MKYKIWDEKEKTWRNKNVVVLQDGRLFDTKKKKHLNQTNQWRYKVLYSTGVLAYDGIEKSRKKVELFEGDIIEECLGDVCRDIGVIEKRKHIFIVIEKWQKEPNGKYIERAINLRELPFVRYVRLGNIYDNPRIDIVNYRYDRNVGEQEVEE